MDIAFVSDWFPPRRGGIESQLRGLGRALTASGARVTAITTQPDARIDGFAVRPIDCLRLPFIDLAVSPRLISMMRAALDEVAPDVVHVHASIVAPAGIAGMVAAMRAGLPLVVTAHSDLATSAPLLDIVGRFSGGGLGGVILSAVSGRIAGQLQRLAPRSVIEVLPNGFDAGFWMCDARPEPPLNAFRMVSAMRLERKKRPQVLPKLRDLVQRSVNRPVELLVAGDGTRRNRLGTNTTAPGWLDARALREVYLSADAFVMPSIHESFGLAALEARASGLPVVGRAGTGLADFIENGVDGFLCDSDAAMAEALTRLATDEKLWRRIAGPRPTLARLDWPRIAAQHLELYARARSSHGQ